MGRQKGVRIQSVGQTRPAPAGLEDGKRGSGAGNVGGFKKLMETQPNQAR